MEFLSASAAVLDHAGGPMAFLMMALGFLALGNVSMSAFGVPQDVAAIIQDRTLERSFHDALFPRLLYRSEAVAEVWPANLGERHVFTRTGRIPVSVRPLIPGTDPTPKSYRVEQWTAEARQQGESIPTHMPTAYVSLADLFIRDGVNLGLNAGETLNRLVRNALFKAYLGGNGITITAVGAAATQLRLASLNGFQEILFNGTPVPVSSVSPLPISIGVIGEPANTVVQAQPLNPADPLGPGIITLGTPTTNPIPVRTSVLASTRSRLVRVGAGATVDALTPANVLTIQTINAAIGKMRANLIPPCPDGFYHVHVDPEGEVQLLADIQFQRMFQSLPDSMVYRDLAIGQIVGSRFYRNTENPTPDNSGDLLDTSGGVVGGLAREASEIGGEVVNQAGVAIKRAIILGGGAIYERYIDESKFITVAGVTGKIGEFSVTNNGIQVMTERIRYIIRSPIDALQQQYMQTWSWSGDFPIPSDGLTGDAARFKRAIVIEFAG